MQQAAQAGERRTAMEEPVRETLDRDRLKVITQEMVEAITSPEYIEAIQAVRNAPEEERLVEASRRLAVDALREAGVRLPEDVRISSRYFEEDLPTGLELGNVSGVNVINELNATRPGLLDELRQSNPDVFERLVTIDLPGTPVGPTGTGGRMPETGISGCAGAGGLTFCGCAGGGG
jgi:hypothetical protein